MKTHRSVKKRATFGRRRNPVANGVSLRREIHRMNNRQKMQKGYVK